MARSSTKKSARRSLLALVVVILALGGLAAGLTKWGGGSMTPRLGLDLEGGTELVLQPQLTGTETISEGQVNRAVDIIRQRIDANGVSEAEITTQGGKSIVVSIPGQPTAEQLDALKKPSQLRFRAVYVQALDSNATPGQAERHAERHGDAHRHPVGHGDRRSDRARPRRAAPRRPSASPTAQNGVVPDALRAATTPATPAPYGHGDRPRDAGTGGHADGSSPDPGRDRGGSQDAGQHGSRGPRLGQGQGRRGRCEGRQGIHRAQLLHPRRRRQGPGRPHAAASPRVARTAPRSTSSARARSTAARSPTRRAATSPAPTASRPPSSRSPCRSRTPARPSSPPSPSGSTACSPSRRSTSSRSCSTRPSSPRPRRMPSSPTGGPRSPAPSPSTPPSSSPTSSSSVRCRSPSRADAGQDLGRSSVRSSCASA